MNSPLRQALALAIAAGALGTTSELRAAAQVSGLPTGSDRRRRTGDPEAAAALQAERQRRKAENFIKQKKGNHGV